MSESRLPLPGHWAHAYYASRGYVLAALLLILAFSRLASEATLKPAWLAMVLAGICLRAWAGLHIGSHSNGLRLESGPLANTGPYRGMRHPLYVSNLLVAAGFLGFANSLPTLGALALWLATAAHHSLLIRWEERVLNAAPVFQNMETRREAPWRLILMLQGRNLAYSAAGVIFLAVLAWKPFSP